MSKVILIWVVAMLCGCSPTPTISMQQENGASDVTATQAQQTRFVVERLGVFKDSLAYNDRRGVYVIKDNKTGAEYIGVSGIGITETGEHWVGVAGKGGHNVEHEE